MKHTLTVTGMHCASCVSLITEALEDEGASDVQVTLEPGKRRGSVTLHSDLPRDAIKQIIEDQGPYAAA